MTYVKTISARIAAACLSVLLCAPFDGTEAAQRKAVQPSFNSDFGSGSASQVKRRLTSNPLANAEACVSSNIVANGLGAITGPILNQCLTAYFPIFTSLATWNSSGQATIPGSNIAVTPSWATASTNLNARFVQRSLSDFGTLDPTGTSDMAAAFNAAIASVASGDVIIIQVPNKTGADTYRLNSTILANGRYVIVDLTSGAGVGSNYGGTGTGLLYVTRVDRYQPDLYETDVQWAGSGSATPNPTFRTTIANNGGRAGIAVSYNYTNYNNGATNTNGGDIAHQLIAAWPNAYGNAGGGVSSIGMFGAYEAAVSPLTSSGDIAAGASWGLSGREMDPINNGPEPTFTEFDSTQTGAGLGVPPTWAAGLVLSPDIWSPDGGYGGSGQFAVGCVSPGQSNNRPTSTSTPHIPTSATGPYVPGWSTCLLIGNNAMNAGGVGIYFGGERGSVVSGPAMLAHHTWPTMLDTSAATLTTSLIKAGTGSTQGIYWGTSLAGIYGDTSGNLHFVGSMTGTLSTPASSSAACTAGQFSDDANYHYVCVATNTWKRVALSSF